MADRGIVDAHASGCDHGLGDAREVRGARGSRRENRLAMGCASRYRHSPRRDAGRLDTRAADGRVARDGECGA